MEQISIENKVNNTLKWLANQIACTQVYKKWDEEFKPESKAESSKSETSKKENSKAESSKPETSQKEDTGYLDGNVFIYKNIGYSSFKGSDESALKYANSLNAIASTLDSRK